jgi:hypothetical protein
LGVRSPASRFKKVVFPEPDFPNCNMASPPASEKSGKEMGDCPGWAKQSEVAFSSMNLVLAAIKLK